MDEQLPVPVTLREIAEETPTIRTFRFDRTFSFRPGQFVMVWVPGVDEIPMALSAPDAISVQKVGEATTALFGLQPGDRLGVRGPFGNGFPEWRRVLAVAGGIGAAPLLPLARLGKVEVFLLGARTKAELPFVDELREHTSLMLATDDGSEGFAGFAAGLFDSIPLREYDRICVCGPERMMDAVLQRLDREGIADRGEFSLHRYMKCGIGVCGSCCMDPSGLRVCRDGPVFRGDLLIGSELGKHTRDASGRKRKA
jgi:dihydroorotate dehydrogenase electron transfer subunit